MIKFFKKLISFFYVPVVRDRVCPECNGVGAEDCFVNCSYCDGRGWVSEEKFNKYKEPIV
jgi:DnaJ-class molecular chaperone